jgi:hypothetical protein
MALFDRASPVLPLATMMVLAGSAVLPLQWSTVVVTAIALAALEGVIVLRTFASGGSLRVVAAMSSLSIVGAIVLGYAAYELTHPGAFAGGRRLAYPFLIATGLRLDGGAWLLMLCGAVSLVPLVLRDEALG